MGNKLCLMGVSLELDLVFRLSNDSPCFVYYRLYTNWKHLATCSLGRVT